LKSEKPEEGREATLLLEAGFGFDPGTCPEKKNKKLKSKRTNEGRKVTLLSESGFDSGTCETYEFL